MNQLVNRVQQLEQENTGLKGEVKRQKHELTILRESLSIKNGLVQRRNSFLESDNKKLRVTNQAFMKEIEALKKKNEDLEQMNETLLGNEFAFENQVQALEQQKQADDETILGQQNQIATQQQALEVAQRGFQALQIVVREGQAEVEGALNAQIRAPHLTQQLMEQHPAIRALEEAFTKLRQVVEEAKAAIDVGLHTGQNAMDDSYEVEHENDEMEMENNGEHDEPNNSEREGSQEETPRGRAIHNEYWHEQRHQEIQRDSVMASLPPPGMRWSPSPMALDGAAAFEFSELSALSEVSTAMAVDNNAEFGLSNKHQYEEYEPSADQDDEVDLVKTAIERPILIPEEERPLTPWTIATESSFHPSRSPSLVGEPRVSTRLRSASTRLSVDHSMEGSMSFDGLANSIQSTDHPPEDHQQPEIGAISYDASHKFHFLINNTAHPTGPSTVTHAAQALIARWEARAPPQGRNHWNTTLKSIRCIFYKMHRSTAALSGKFESQSDRSGAYPNTACSLCRKSRRPCLVKWEYMARPCVLPLPEEYRRGFEPRDEGYWIWKWGGERDERETVERSRTSDSGGGAASGTKKGSEACLAQSKKLKRPSACVGREARR